MKTFWHFNEAGGTDVDMLTPMLLFSSQLTLWAPSKLILEKAHRDGLCPFDADEFLELLRNDCLRITAREDWLVNGDQRRNSGWEGAVFDREFDGEILKIFTEDHGNEDARVFTAPDARGYSVADEEIETRGRRYLKALPYVRDRRIPTGTFERINRTIACPSKDWTAELEQRATRELIRDAVNHEDARLNTRSDFSVEVDRDATGVFSDIADRDGAEPSSETDFTLDNICRAIDIAKNLSGNETVEGIVEIKKDAKEKKFLLDLQMSEYKYMKERLKNQISSGHDAITIYEEFFGKKIEGKILGPIGLMPATAAIYSIRKKKMHRRDVIFSLLGLGISASIVGGNLLERSSLISERDYTGPRWPFLLRFGDNDPTRQMILDMLKFLENISQ